MTKPTGFPAETEKMPIKTGETTPPEIDTKESFPAELEKLPFREEFPKETQQLPIIFENKKVERDDLKKDFDNKAWKDTLEVTGSSKIGTRESKKLKTNIHFFEKLNNYSKKYHDGNLKAAIKEIAKIKINPGETGKSKELNSLYSTITSTAKRSDFKFDTSGLKLESNIPQMKNTIDLNVAMTGDMIIRIAKDVTVERGDLLMSAGDGTAKPQDDDIVRSSTIAKIISTNHTATYADGSKAYPCVLMAC